MFKREKERGREEKVSERTFLFCYLISEYFQARISLLVVVFSLSIIKELNIFLNYWFRSLYLIR
jgi:hypothetical protein